MGNETSTITLKAYWTHDNDMENQAIIFAENRAKAIYASPAYGWGGEYINVRATRKSEFDKYADQGFVPKEEMLKDGWWFECHGYNDRGRRCCKYLTIDDNPIVSDDHVYCNENCRTQKRLEE